MDTRAVIDAVKKSFKEGGSVKIYYPQTDTHKEGWREITPHSLSTDLPPRGELLVPDEDTISPGHILNALNEKKELRSFIIGKIKFIKKV